MSGANWYVVAQDLRQQLELARSSLRVAKEDLTQVQRELEAAREALRRIEGMSRSLRLIMSEIGDAARAALSTHAPKTERTFTEAQVLTYVEHGIRAGFGLGQNSHETDDFAQRARTILGGDRE